MSKLRIIVVGLGIQGMKRRALLGDSCSAIVDPISMEAQFRKVEDVPLDNFDAAFVCTPDALKLPIIEYLVNHGKHVLCEKPLTFPKLEDFHRIESLANTNNAKVYTAYNHRFERSISETKKIVDNGILGKIYQIRIFYGNGTAHLVANSNWRDTGLGVISDLGSHCVNLINYWFPNLIFSLQVSNFDSFENQAPDSALLISNNSNPRIIIELSLCSWKNTFRAEIVGENGAIGVYGLSKWGESKLVRQERVLPSGVPIETTTLYEAGDKSWDLEQSYFFKLVSSKTPVDLKIDKLIFNILNLSSSFKN